MIADYSRGVHSVQQAASWAEAYLGKKECKKASGFYTMLIILSAFPI